MRTPLDARRLDHSALIELYLVHVVSVRLNPLRKIVRRRLVPTAIVSRDARGPVGVLGWTHATRWCRFASGICPCAIETFTHSVEIQSNWKKNGQGPKAQQSRNQEAKNEKGCSGR